MEQVVVIQESFYGDFCIKHAEDYTGSLYASQTGNPGTGYYDAPAIFKVEVYRNGILTGSFNNESTLGIGSPLQIQYADRINTTDNFEFKMYILVRTGSTFSYKYFYSWTTSDDNRLEQGTDGVIDFVLGSCTPNADVQLAPYQNLPISAVVDATIGNPGYWDLYITSVTPGGVYDFPTNQHLVTFCGDPNHYLSVGTHNMNVYTSLYSNSWPAGMPFTLEKIAKANWLFNELYKPDNAYGIYMPTLTDAQGDIVQLALRKILNDVNVTGTALTMATDANIHGSFVPMPGGYAAVLFIKNGDPSYQLVFTIVDP